MKFTDGYCQLLAGVRPTYATHIRDIEVADDPVTVFAPSRPVTGRGDTLSCPVLTIRCSAPMEGVIRVQAAHHTGGRRPGPSFGVHEQATAPVIEVGDTTLSFGSGDLTALLRRDGGWHAGFVADGRQVVAAGEKSLALMTMLDGSTHLRVQLTLGVGDLVYGLGERFGPLVKNGQSVDMWNADGGTSSEQAYKNIPFLLTNAGYGLLVNTPGRVSFEIGSEGVSRLQFSVPGEEVDYLVIYGPSPKEILTRYTALTGRPPEVPPWSYGLWLSTSFTTDYDEDTVAHFVAGMADRDIPLSVLHFDCFWMREYHRCDFVWDPVTFPDPAGMLARLKERGLRISVWINPYIAQRSALFDEGKRLGHLVSWADGSVWQTDQWQAGMGLVDFTNPAAYTWFQDKLAVLLDQGVDCFKTDFGERIPVDVVWHDGSDPERMHNFYPQLYNRAVFELLERRRGPGQAVVFARSATTGGQAFPVHWGGDCDSTYESMAESLRGGLSLALSGFGYWSHDIGGFEGTPDAGVFKRWAAFGLLSSHSRLHGSDSYRVPWAFDDEAVSVVSRFARLKARLMPYLLETGHRAAIEGWPVMRPMVLEYPDDPAVAYLDCQYLLGPSLLVAPVFSADGRVRFYLPEGTWTNLLTGACVDGPAWHEETHPMDSLPLYVRPDTVLPLGSSGDGPEYDWLDAVELVLFELAAGHRSTVRVPGRDGPATFTVQRLGDRVTIMTDSTRPWFVRAVNRVIASSPDAEPDGSVLRVRDGARELSFELGATR